jgi:hypothetical protein
MGAFGTSLLKAALSGKMLELQVTTLKLAGYLHPE